MNSRLTRPLLTAVVSGALVAGGAVYAGPSYAATPVRAAGSTLTQDPPPTLPDPSETSSGPAADPTTAAPTATSAPASTTSAPTSAPTTTTAAPTATSAPASTTSAPTSVPPTTTSAPTPTGPSTTPPTADTKAPTGSFKIDRWGVWIGQSVTVTLVGVNDDSGADKVTRVITWGDGTTSTVPANQASIAKVYSRAGHFPITLTLSDAAGNKTVAKSGGPVVSNPVKAKLNKYTVWPGETFKVTFSGVPAGTSKITLYWGDGRAVALKGKNQTVSKYYFNQPNGLTIPAGAKTLQVVFTNKNGSTSKLYAGRVTVRKDSWKPVVKINTPKKYNKVSSWKTVTGTASDKGSGIRSMDVIVVKVNMSGAGYCLTAKKTWMRVNDNTSDANLAKCDLRVKVSKGKWSVPVKGLQKGAISVVAFAYDWADLDSRSVQVTKALTKA